MLSHPTHPSLKRRLSANLLLSGTLAIAALQLAATAGPLREKLDFGPVAAGASLLGLLLASFWLRRTIAPLCDIDVQLHHLSDDDTGSVALKPVPAKGVAALAWNRLQERVATQQALEKLEARLNESLGSSASQGSLQMLDSLPDGIAVTDRENNIALANNAFRALAGAAPDADLRKRDLAELLAGIAREEKIPVDLTADSGKRMLSFELYRGKELTDGVLKVFRYALFEEDRESQNHIWLVRDITQQKLADEMRTQFLQTATHELRTPLMNICAYAETLELTDDLDVEQQKQFCNIINTEAMRLSRFIDELLDVSRMEAGAMSLARHETDMERLLQDAIEKVSPLMKQKRLDFDTKFAPKLPKLNIDKDKYASALVNLLGNAAKYTPEGGQVKFTVDAGEQEMEFQIEDSGHGISQEDLPRIFDRFFRSNDERVREVTGTGLGLAFTNEVIRLHGGRIHVHSELNRGTKFTVTMPIR